MHWPFAHGNHVSSVLWRENKAITCHLAEGHLSCKLSDSEHHWELGNNQEGPIKKKMFIYLLICLDLTKYLIWLFTKEALDT